MIFEELRTKTLKKRIAVTKNVTIALEEEIIAAAEAAGLDLSEILSQALRRALPELQPEQREAENRKWQEENREAIRSVNSLIEKHGLFSDGRRMF